MSDEVVTLASFVAIFIKCRDEHPFTELHRCAVFVLGGAVSL